jgi:hypothetical protein
VGRLDRLCPSLSCCRRRNPGEQDLAAAREAEAAIAEGEQTVPLEELARELGLRLG